MMNVLVVDVGGTHVKILATGKKDKREFASGPKLTAPKMVSRVKKLAQDWSYQAPTDVVIGGGNVGKLKELPPGCRAGDNSNAFTGGFRMWEPRRQAGLREWSRL